MNMTLLEIVQDILSDMSSDEVNSIGDTIESEQVAQIVKSTYFDIISNREIPSNESLINLDGLGDTAHPNYLKIPAGVQKIKWIKYDHQVNSLITYHDLVFLEKEDFLHRILSNAEDDADVDVVADFSGVNLLIRTDKNPEHWTTFDNNYICCDSYDSTIDATLQSSKTITWGITEPTWTHSDTFVPDLDTNLFPLLLAEAKSVCFVRLKEVTDAKAEQQSRRQLLRSQNDLHRTKQPTLMKDYGRKRRG